MGLRKFLHEGFILGGSLRFQAKFLLTLGPFSPAIIWMESGMGLGCMGGMIPLLILAYKHIKFRFHQDPFLHNEYSPQPNPLCRQLLTLLVILLAIQDCPVSRKRLR